MKTSLFTLLAIFMLFLGTSYAEVTLTAPAYLNDESYLMTEETDFNAIDSNVFYSSSKCVHPVDMTDHYLCNQTPGCPMCVFYEPDSSKFGVPQVEEQKWITKAPSDW